MINIHQLYSINEFTTNAHQIIHLPIAYKKIGPLENHNNFLTENCNGKLGKSITSSHGIVEQSLNRAELNIYANLNLIEVKDNRFISSSPAYKFNNSTCYKSVKKNSLKIFSFNNSHSVLKDYFVETDKSFFRVNYFFVRNSSLYFSGSMIQNLGEFEFSFEENNLTLNYILKAKLTQIVRNVSIDEIKNRVLFVNSFQDAKSVFDKHSGFIIKFVHKFNN